MTFAASAWRARLALAGFVLLGRSVSPARAQSPRETARVGLYQRACDGGDSVACYNLGVAYAAGTGVPL